SFSSSPTAASSATMFRSVKSILFWERNSFTLPQNVQPGWLKHDHLLAHRQSPSSSIAIRRGIALRSLDEPERAPRGSKAGRFPHALQSNSLPLDAKERNGRNDKMNSRRSSGLLGRPARAQTFEPRQVRLAPLVAA